jgi:gamma-glutamyl-gamma-aminobutyrate hydrolase PuuD
MNTVFLTTSIRENKDYHETVATLDIEWINFFNHLNCTVIPICHANNSEELFEKIKPCGVILTGGNNLSIIENKLVNNIRDQIDSTVYEQAKKSSIPIIGICRGMQFIANKLGLEVKPCSTNHVINEHAISWCGTSELWNNLSFPKSVNSYHNYCIYGSHSDIEILATASDNSIEAFRHKKIACLGIMWHPERNIPTQKSDID